VLSDIEKCKENGFPPSPKAPLALHRKARGNDEQRCSVLAGAYVRSVDKGPERWYKMNIKEHRSARLNSENRGAEITAGWSAENTGKPGEERL